MKLSDEWKLYLGMACSILVVASALAFAGRIESVKTKCEDGIACSGDKEKDRGPGLGRGIMDMPYDNSGKKRLTKEEVEIYRSQNETLGQQLQDCAEEAQRRIDAQRGDLKRKKSHPELDASECIRMVDQDDFHGFENTCPHAVNAVFCALKPRSDTWATSHDCELQRFGTEIFAPKERKPAVTRYATTIMFGACRSPESIVSDYKYIEGNSFPYRCFSMDDVTDEYGLGREQLESCQASKMEKQVEERIAALKESEETSRRLRESEQRLAKETERLARVREALKDAESDTSDEKVIESSCGIDGEWRGRNNFHGFIRSVNGGISVTGDGAASAFFYKAIGNDTYRYVVSDAAHCDITVVGNNRLRESCTGDSAYSITRVGSCP